jgi:hypothetical protein
MPDQVLGRKHDIVEKHLIETMRACHIDYRLHRNAGEIHGADEVRDSAVLRYISIGSCDQNAELRMMTTGRPDLRTVHNVVLAVLDGSCRKAGEV